VTLALIYFSEPVVAMFFQRGAFTQADTYAVSQVQAMYLLQVPPYILSMLFVRLISALKANQLMLWGNILNLSMCIGLTYFLMQWFGAVGIALATSMMYLVSTAFLALVSLRLIKKKQESAIISCV
jgi:putative peptidoglycan lipid II flippase